MPLLSFVLLAILHTLILANVVVVERNEAATLQLSRYVSTTGMRNLVAHDRARVKAMRDRAFGSEGAASNEPIVNAAFSYLAAVGVGSPPTTYQLLVDTGSANTWVGGVNPYVPTSTSNLTRDQVTIGYGSGGMFGQEYIDKVTLTPRLVIPKQSIGVASFTWGFGGIDGILGLGPVDLSIGTLNPDTTSPVPTVTDNLFANGTIHKNEIGIYFRPSKTALDSNGEITWGGTDGNKIIGPVMYFPVTSTFPSNKYWGIDQSIKYGTETILPLSAGIVDTGTTLIFIASDAYAKYVSLTGAVYDSSVGLLSITPDQYKNLSCLNFVIGGTTFELIPNAQIWPRSLNTMIGGNSSHIYLIVADIGIPSGQGFDFVNGFSFLERYYSAYDTTNKRVGFAFTRHTMEVIN